ncbi:hypothetical protein GA0074694_4399 [Micromonospora inyonensis]|uniref:Uncharacterized protein n=1 Tax=Micromonospora inyonensis TaxID=47866 RepID=A0A1C6S9H6_9ACTN|nr:hypothetical protein GA0074694_4399 [Micromonospora inyonensis]
MEGDVPFEEALGGVRVAVQEQDRVRGGTSDALVACRGPSAAGRQLDEAEVEALAVVRHGGVVLGPLRPAVAHHDHFEPVGRQ